jgi:hypothetical protein
MFDLVPPLKYMEKYKELYDKGNKIVEDGNKIFGSIIEMASRNNLKDFMTYGEYTKANHGNGPLIIEPKEIAPFSRGLFLFIF